jgi:hypothetical protein
MSGRRRLFFCSRMARGSLDDIYTFRGEFVQAESLNQYLLDK